MTSISNHDQNNEATVQPHADLSSMTLSSTAIYGNVLTSISPSKELSDKSTETCAHGVNVYDVGDTWHLNCSVYCRCFPHQQVVCRSSCFNYGIIPRGCQLASPHGESCCKLLVCLNLHNIRSFGTPQWSTKPMLDPLDVLQNKLKPDILDVWKTNDLYNGEQSKTSKSLSKEASMQPTYSISSNLAARQGFGIRMPPRTLFIPYRDESSMSTLSTMIRPVMISSSSEERLKSNNDLKVQLPKQNTKSESILHNDISLSNNNAFVGSYPTDSLNSPVTDLHLSPFAKVDAYIKPSIVTLDKRKEMSITAMGKILGCTIRGKLVRQGENWIENCERKCICEDEINHRISCVPFRCEQ
ncbi:hypothetical protein DPMN_008585 [Dreissena polymorpha]|uniref:VWFC domain-containing protein n=1 Tax=Dreissena polymorpha TaxID=45954 RepID=A0A9D4MVE3_DREPO|nr:hypothetical protein DPMN_008585 [Dreissena polymorpha]